MLILVFIILIGAVALSAVVNGYVSVQANGGSLSNDEVNTVYAMSIVTTVLIGIALFILIIYAAWWWYKTRELAWPDDPGYNEAKALEMQKQQQAPLMEQPRGPVQQYGGRESIASRHAAMTSVY